MTWLFLFPVSTIHLTHRGTKIIAQKPKKQPPERDIFKKYRKKEAAFPLKPPETRPLSNPI